MCLLSNKVIGASGLIGNDLNFRHINWILISPHSQGSGVGSCIMNKAIDIANKANLNYIKIAASHLSAPFFVKFGAKSVLEIKHGWGPDMHRVDMELHL